MFRGRNLKVTLFLYNSYMHIKSLEDIQKFEVLFEQDANDREIKIYSLENCQFSGSNLFYPNVLVKSGDCFYEPMKEKTMSLDGVKLIKEIKFDDSTKSYDQDLFFFVYNTDNYYHFVYDTLPYLISFFHLKKTNEDIKLLMNFPFGKNEHYKFVLEFLEILGLSSDDIILIEKDVNYKKIFFSTSYTHGNDSNAPPRKEIFDFFKIIKNLALKEITRLGESPKKFYISRRSWVHGDTSNIGTNYTTRRCLSDENDLVSVLASHDFVEVFTETLTTREKIALFDRAEVIVGAIGGGLCNVLFSNPQTKLYCLVSPTFLDINMRFQFSLDKVETHYFKNCYHVEKSNLKTYMRVKIPDLSIVGEITKVDNDKVEVSYVDTFVSGWNACVDLNKIVVKKEDVIPLDNGLNSPWSIDVNEFVNFIISE